MSAGDAVAPDIQEHVRERLEAVAAEEGVEILFAIESGSRAWGFASPDSDYDVRFVYRHPRDWYISLREERDVIERDLDAREIDLSGWDLRKALRLLLRWNPALHEWLVSPITYCESGGCRPEMRALYEGHADLRAVGHHYLSIARSQWSKMAGRDEVPLKKYFYALRPLMALKWLETRHRVPPMDFEALRTASPWPSEMDGAVDDLIALKRATPELGQGRRVPAIDRWIETILRDVDPARLPRQGAGDVARGAADVLFRRLLSEI